MCPVGRISESVPENRTDLEIRPTCNPPIGSPEHAGVADRKLAGILVEVLPDRRHVIGIGLNVNHHLADAPAELQNTAATLRDLSGLEHDRTGVLIDLLRRLDGRSHNCVKTLKKLLPEPIRCACNAAGP